MNIQVTVAGPEHLKYAQQICDEVYVSALERKTGIARRTPEYICEKMLGGKGVIALTDEGELAGFSYIESWSGKSFVANSGLIVVHKFRGMGIAKRIKAGTFKLSRQLFPDAKIFSITTGAAVMKMNYEFGFRPVPFSELTDDPEFWKGCQGCRHYDILESHDFKMCICTGLLYDPKEHLEIHHPDEEDSLLSASASSAAPALQLVNCFVCWSSTRPSKSLLSTRRATQARPYIMFTADCSAIRIWYSAVNITLQTSTCFSSAEGTAEAAHSGRNIPVPGT